MGALSSLQTLGANVFPRKSPFTLGTGGNPAAFASSPAPEGYRWDFTTLYGERVTLSGEPVVDLVRTN